MQGTLVMLVALSGLGCHNKGCEIAYAPPTYMGCFSGGCYADVYPGPAMPACYAGCYGGCYSGCYGCYGIGYAGCYSGCYGGCYGGGCYGGWYGGCYGAGYSGCGHRRHGCGGGGGLFHCRRRSSCDTCAYVEPLCYGGCGYGYGAAYAPAVFGSAVGMNYPSLPSSQSLTVPSKQYGGTTGQSMTTMPSEVAPPVPANPVSPSTTAPPAPATTVPATESPVEPATPPAPRPAAPAAPRVPAT